MARVQFQTFIPVLCPSTKKAIIPHVQKLLGGHLIMPDNSHGICGCLRSYTRKKKKEKEMWLFIHAHNITPTLWLVSVGPSITCVQFFFNYGIPCLRGTLRRSTNEVSNVFYSQLVSFERDCRVDV